MISKPDSNISNLQTILSSNVDSKRATDMSKYMRNKFVFFGIAAPLRKELFRRFIKAHGWPEMSRLEAVCQELYCLPERELHYFAMEMIERNIKKLNQSSIKLFEYMIVTASWWDTVDFIAANILGKFFKMYPELTASLTAKMDEFR